ncbi:MAG TPA: SBBP repeat-containing protein [Pyrinomonadaceae bacterium]|jgi:hypothetical protein
MKIPKNNLIQTLLCQLLISAAAFNFISPAIYALNVSIKKYKSGEQSRTFSQKSPPQNDSAKTAAAVESLNKMPLSFEENLGQFEKEVRFVSQNPQRTLFLTASAAAVFSFQSPDAEEKFSVLRMKLSRANKNPKLKGIEANPAKINYFRGNDPRRWQSNVSTYRRVKYEEAYHGVDLFWYGNENNDLEYDFVVKPNADYRQIEIKFDGAEKIEIERGGDLLIHLGGAVLRQRKPFTYQHEPGGARREVESVYELSGKNRIKFRVGGYDRSKNLVIDPLIIQYSTFLGGNDEDSGNDIAVDSGGNVYIAGTTRSPNFPTTAGAVSNSKRSLFDTVFVSKFDATGTRLIYSTYLGGGSRFGEKGMGIAVDAAGSAYVVGETYSNDFPTTLRAFERFKRWGDDDEDAFVTKLSADGSHLIYSTFLGGNDDDVAYDVAVDAGGSAHVVGKTDSGPWLAPGGFPTTPGALPAPNGGGFYTKVNAAGTDLEYSTLLSGTGYDEAQKVVIDAAGSAYVMGFTGSTNFPVVPGSFDTTHNGNYDIFVMKFNSHGALAYSTYLGGSAYEGINNGFGLAVDRDGYCYVLAPSGSSDFPTTPGALDRVQNNYEAFVAKLSPHGSNLVFATFLSPLNNGPNYGYSLAVDPQGRIYVTGETGADSFPQMSCLYRRFIAQIASDGTAFRNVSCYASGFGRNTAITIDSKGRIFITGSASDNYPTTADAYDRTPNGNTDAMFTRLKFASNALDSDFDGDGRADISVFRPSDGTWYLLGSQNGFSATQFGQAGDKLVPADYDGDGKTDIAVWGGERENAAPAFYILKSSDNTLKIQAFGQAGDDPAPGDYDGDGKADAAVYRAASASGQQSYFYYLGSLNNPSGQLSAAAWGAAGDKSVAGDYNGDGKLDFAVYRASQQKWYVLLNGEGANFLEAPFGLPTDKLVPKDYDGDGKTDLAVFRPSNGTWYIKQSTNNQVVAPQWGIETDSPVPADYDGDGKIDIAVRRGGQWMIKRSSDGTANFGTIFGLATDVPVQSAFVR